MLSRSQWEALSTHGNKIGEKASSGMRKGSGRSYGRAHSKKGWRGVGQEEEERGNEPKPKFDKKKIKCYNCGIFRHFVSEYCKPKKEKAYKVKMGDDGIALLMLETCELMETKEETTDPVSLVGEKV